MKRSSKLIISLMAIVCVVALMATGVHGAVSASFSIINSVIYVFQGKNITITLYAGNALGAPTTDSVINTISCPDGSAIGNSLPATHNITNYKFLGWYTYDFAKGEWGTKLFESTTVVASADATDYNLALFEKYGGYVSTGNVVIAPSGSTDIPDLGLSLTITNGNGTVGGVAGGATSVTIPGSVYDSNGNEVEITSVLKIDDNWQNVKSITFAEPSKITTIGGDSMLGLKNLESLILPSSLKTIEKTALKDLDKLQWIVIPASVTKIEDPGIEGVQKGCKVFYEGTVKYNNKGKPIWPSGWAGEWIKESSNCTFYCGIGVTWDYDANGVPQPL